MLSSVPALLEDAPSEIAPMNKILSIFEEEKDYLYDHFK